MGQLEVALHLVKNIDECLVVVVKNKHLAVDGGHQNFNDSQLRLVKTVTKGQVYILRFRRGSEVVLVVKFEFVHAGGYVGHHLAGVRGVSKVEQQQRV